MIEPSKLHLYVDGELTLSQKQEVEAQLSACQESQKEVASIRALKETLGTQMPTQTCEATWAECQKRIETLHRVEKSGNFITRYSWAFVTGVAAIVLVGGFFSRTAQRSSFSSSDLAGVVTRAREVSPKQQLQNAALDELLKTADARLNQLRVINGREQVLDGHRITEVELSDTNGPISLLVLHERANFESLVPMNKGYLKGEVAASKNCVAWFSQGRSFVLIGDRSHESLLQLAEKFFPASE